MKLLGLMGAGVIAGGLAAACSTADYYPVGSATVTSSLPWVSNDQAVERISLERCRREVSCDNIGPNRLWENISACQRDVRTQTRDYFDSQSCGAGIDVYGLASCVDRIRNARCGEEGAGVPRLTECRASRLCR